jgi:hypothetical protein
MRRFSALAAVLVVITFYYSCTKDKAQQPPVNTCASVDSATNTYTLRIKGIMDNNCASGGCHDAGSASSNVILDTYAATKNSFQTKPCLCAIKQEGGCLPMPQGGAKLADSLITFIQCWSDNGYPQ